MKKDSRCGSTTTLFLVSNPGLALKKYADSAIYIVKGFFTLKERRISKNAKMFIYSRPALHISISCNPVKEESM